MAEDDEAPAATFADDIHFRSGLGCSSCHGGDPQADDPDEAMSEEAGFIGAPAKEDIPNLCGKCHADLGYMRVYDPSARTDQLEEYYTSVHGRKLLNGDRNVATCADCHAVHRIRPVDEPKSSVHPTNVPATCGACHSDKKLMDGYGIPSDQVAKYTKSVHGVALFEKNDLSAPTCNDCHGNHGAVPPGVASVVHVCGMCHASEQDIFEKGRKGEIFRELEMPGCVSCHTHHAIRKPTEKMISFEQGGLCAECHDPDEEEPVATGTAIRGMLDSLVVTYDRAKAEVHEAEQKGMEVSEEDFLLRDAKQKIFESRAHVHSFDADALRPHADEGLKIASKALADAEGAIRDYHYRRRGFAVSTLLLTVLAALIYMKIRSIDREK
jgi:predicted CXXCH cytochrome family protein